MELALFMEQKTLSLAHFRVNKLCVFTRPALLNMAQKQNELMGSRCISQGTSGSQRKSTLPHRNTNTDTLEGGREMSKVMGESAS